MVYTIYCVGKKMLWTVEIFFKKGVDNEKKVW